MIFAYDTETTGKYNFKLPPDHPSQPHICQFAGVLVTGDKRIIQEISIPVKPNGWKLTEELTAIHGWSQEDCEKYGMPIEEVVKLFHHMQSLATIKVGHNLGFDEKMMQRSGATLITERMPIYDTMFKGTDVAKIEKVGGGYKWPKLGELYQHLFGVELQNAHNAMVDIKATLRIYFKLREMGINA